MKRVVYLGNVWEYPGALAGLDGVRVAALLYEEEGDAEGALRAARRTGARTCRVRDDSEVRAALEGVGPVDLGVIANFGIILSVQTLAFAGYGFINCHPGLLPGQKGREPVSRLWKSGGGAAGLTFHVAEARPDSGRVLAVALHPVDPHLSLDKNLRAIYLAGIPLLSSVVSSRLAWQCSIFRRKM